MSAALTPAGQISEAWFALIEFGAAAGGRNVAQLPGCFEARIDADWWMAANGATTPRLASNGMEVPGLAVYVERQGWPAGIIDMHGGTLLMGTEDELIAACRAAQARLEAGAS